MDVLISNRLKNLTDIIKQKAIYQKVMLLYDNSTSQTKINEVYFAVKDFCMFNKMDLNNINKEELLNGYKLLIFCCNCSSLKNFNINREDFINVYYPTNKNITHFFTNQFNLLTKDCFLLLHSSDLDLGLVSSSYFNSFINYTNSLLNFQPACMPQPQELNIFSIVNIFNEIAQPFYFYDLEIFNNINCEYDNLIILHLIILDAFLTLINSIKDNDFNLIDVYKIAKHNYPLVDKCYALVFDKSFYNSVVLNYNHLYSACLKTKNKILSLISLNDNSLTYVDDLIVNIKEYLKSSNCKLNYLYFFNIFGN